jgi:hypothetical protein
MAFKMQIFFELVCESLQSSKIQKFTAKSMLPIWRAVQLRQVVKNAAIPTCNVRINYLTVFNTLILFELLLNQRNYRYAQSGVAIKKGL